MEQAGRGVKSFFSFSWRRLSRTKSWLEIEGGRDSLGGIKGRVLQAS